MKLLGPPRQPCLGLALAAAIGIIVAEFCPRLVFASGLAMLATALCGVALLLRPRLFPTYVFVGWTFLLLHLLQTTQTPGLWLAARLGERPRAVAVTGAVITEPKISPNGFASFLLRLKNIELEGKQECTNATILVRWRSNPQFGDELKLFGIAAPVLPPRNPGEFDMRSYLARNDVRRRLFVRYEEDGNLLRHAGGNPILRVAQKSRAWLQATLSRGLDDSPEVQNFIGGIALGLRHQTPEDIEEPFQQTGTLHLFAVAGLHVGIVGRLLWMLARVVRLSRQWAAACIIPALFFYSAITGLHVSSVRAAIMGAVLFGGSLFERRVFTLNSLAAAAFILLCWNTNELFSTGFQLSFAVVGTIVLLADPVARLVRGYGAPDPFLPSSLLRAPRRAFDSVMRWFGTGISVSFAAWFGSLVLLFWYFHLVTPVSLAANLVVVPIAFFILATALLSVISAPLPWLSVLFNNANWALAQLVLAIVHAFAQIPAGHYYLAHPPWFKQRIAEVDVLDLGAGGAVRLRTGNGDWLFDCGSERDYERLLREHLHAAGVNGLRGLLLTHGDSLHIGGATKLLSDLRPAVLIDNPLPDRSIVHRRLRDFVQRHQISSKSLHAGESFELGRNVVARILYPPRLALADKVDDQSFVVQVVIGGTRALFLSDSGSNTETALLHSGSDLRSEIVVKGQHHSGQSGSAEFLTAVAPKLIIATSCDFPEQERIKDEWADWVRGHGITLFRQDETGAVRLRFLPEQWEARAYLTNQVFRSSSQ